MNIDVTLTSNDTNITSNHISARALKSRRTRLSVDEACIFIQQEAQMPRTLRLTWLRAISKGRVLSKFKESLDIYGKVCTVYYNNIQHVYGY